jgi:hypothetical protein
VKATYRKLVVFLADILMGNVLHTPCSFRFLALALLLVEVLDQVNPSLGQVLVRGILGSGTE